MRAPCECVQIDWIPVVLPFWLVGHSVGLLYMWQIPLCRRRRDIRPFTWQSNSKTKKNIADFLHAFRRANTCQFAHDYQRGWCSLTHFQLWRHCCCSCCSSPSPWSCDTTFLCQWHWCCVLLHQASTRACCKLGPHT